MSKDMVCSHYHRSYTTGTLEVDITATDTRGFDADVYLALFKANSVLYIGQQGLRFSNPEIVGWVGVDADVRFGLS